MYILFITSTHTFRKCKNLAGQNTFQILLINDANMIGDWRQGMTEAVFLKLGRSRSSYLKKLGLWPKA